MGRICTCFVICVYLRLFGLASAFSLKNFSGLFIPHPETENSTKLSAVDAPMKRKLDSIPCDQKAKVQYVTESKKEFEYIIKETKQALKNVDGIKKCKSQLRIAIQRISSARIFVSRLDFQKTRGRIVTAKIEIEFCYGIVSKLPEKASALSFLKSALDHIPAAYSWSDKGRICNFQSRMQASPPPPVLDLNANSPPSATPFSDFLIESSPENVVLNSNSFTLSYNDRDVRIRSNEAFSYGIFSLDFKCPPSFGGMQIAFYLASNADDPSRDSLMFEFIGDDVTRMRATVIANGKRAGISTTQLPFDCSQAFHKYTLSWGSKLIMFSVDGNLIRSVDVSNVHETAFFPPSTSMFFYASIRRPPNSGFGMYNKDGKPFNTIFRNFMVSSLSDSETLSVPPLPSKPLRLGFPAILFCRENTIISRTNARLSYGEGSCYGGNFRSPRRYNYGMFSAYIKCSKGNTSGLITSFYTSSFEGNPRIQDEIDFEFVGNNKKFVQTNFYVNGKGGNEYIVALNFDSSEDFHKYTILWTPTKLQWLVDDRLVRTVVKATWLASGKTYPTKPSYLYASVWNADNGLWSGKYDGKDAPFYVEYKDIQVYSSPQLK